METMAALYGSKQTSSGGRPRRLLKSRRGRIDKLQAEARKAAQRLIPSQHFFFWVFFSFVLSLGLFVSTRDGGVFRAERLASAIKKSPTPIPLHNNAFSAAASAFTWLAHVHLAFRGARTECARSGGVRHLFVVSADLTDKVVEGVLDVDARLRWCFDEFAAELMSQFLTLCKASEISIGRESQLTKETNLLARRHAPSPNRTCWRPQ